MGTGLVDGWFGWGRFWGVWITEGNWLRCVGAGIYCEPGDFYVDPWRPVERAVVTHGHADHTRRGMGRYWCSRSGAGLVRKRVGGEARIEGMEFGEEWELGGVRISLHAAGHILGSAQVRMEYGGEVVVVTGDYNSSHKHGAAERFEVVRCDTLVTESTFGLPIYQWPEAEEVLEDIRKWWRKNRERGRTSVIPCYPLGKSQRLLAAMVGEDAPVALHGNGRGFLPIYEEAGVAFPELCPLDEKGLGRLRGAGLLLMSFAGQPPKLLDKLGALSVGGVSGWMQVRGARRNRSFDRGFVLSDHADWAGLLRCVEASGARRVGVTHGQTEGFARYLREVIGVESFVVSTRFGDNGDGGEASREKGV